MPATVRPMSRQEFDVWQASSIDSYAEDLARASGRSLAAALERAREEFPKLLPDGLATADTWLLRILDGEGTPVGVLWIGPHPDRPGAAYIYDIAIDEPYRGRGFGRDAMKAAEALVTAAGIGEIGLNVFGFNVPAQALYASLGYRVVATQMAKVLTSERQPT